MYGSVPTTINSQDDIKARSVSKYRTAIIFFSLVALAATAVVSMSTAHPSFLRDNTPTFSKSSPEKLSGLPQQIRKKLAAHPTHVSSFSTQASLTNPGYQSDYSEIPVILMQTKDASLPILSDDDSRWHFSTGVYVDDSTAPAILAHFGKYRSQYSDWILMVLQPNAEVWDALTPTHQTEDDFAVGFLLYDSDDSKIMQGLWQIYFSAIPAFEIDESTTELSADRIFVVNSKSTTYLHTVVVNNDLIVGNTATVESFFIDKDSYNVDVLPGVEEGIIVSDASVSVIFPDGTSNQYQMTDDDTDGMYTLALPLEQPGTHQLFISLEGQSASDSTIIKRTQNIDLTVIDSSCYYDLIEKVFAQPSDSYPDYFDIYFGVKQPSVTSTSTCTKDDEYFSDIHLQAEIWAEDNDGNMQPVTWISGMVVPNTLDSEDGLWYSLAAHKQWFSQIDAKAQGKIELRYIKALDRQYHIPVASIDSITLDVRSYLEYPEKSLDIELLMSSPSEGNFENDLYVDMAHGPKPDSNVFLPANELSTSLTLFLSHGYCATTSTWPTSDFSSAYVFASGYDEGVSNDRFARELLQYSLQYGTKNQFSFIGHSQGGLAGLQLYTYYWSGLDWKSQGKGRKIQSMASPYRGSPLMMTALLDLIESIFGYGCGGVSDISVTGAHHWLTTIPTDRRAVVYYYNVWGGYEDCSWYEFWCDDDDTDECDWVSGLLLKDKNDGVCNGDLNNLPSGIGASGNPYDPYCHTTDMDHTSCYEWTSNNEDMDSKAARP